MPHVRCTRTHAIVDESASLPSDHGPSPEPSACGPHEPSPRWFRRIQSTHFGKREDRGDPGAGTMATHAVSYDNGGGGGPVLRSCSLILSSTGFSLLLMLLPPRAACTARRVRVGRNSRPGLCRRRMEDWCPRRRGSWGDDGLSNTIATAFARYEFTYCCCDETTDRTESVL